MHVGQTVLYVLSEENAIFFVNELTREGQLLPATVLKCYTAQKLGHDNFGDLSDDPQQSSGVADLNVQLPGRLLFVAKAMEDMSPKAVNEYGTGITAYPAPGKFTQISPASLLS
jgi:hypothetical protein